MLFSGDHIMNGSTVVIAPPDGDMDAYLSQLHRLRALGLRSIAPGHGRLITAPIAKIDEYLTHRGERERQVVTELSKSPVTVDHLVKTIYGDVNPALHPVAKYSVWAHLRKLMSDRRAHSDKPDAVDGEWVAK
jgi:hydroxyacylglutathione hydrolase